MVDNRTEKLAKLVVNYCLEVKKYENVVIEGDIEAKDLVISLYKEIMLKGAHPILRIKISELEPIFYKYAKEHHITKFPKHTYYIVKNAQKYIIIDTKKDVRALSSINQKKITKRQKIIDPIMESIYNGGDKIRSCNVAFPCKAYAEEANMSIEEWTNFVFKTCLMDWKKLSKSASRILKKFKKGKKVHLIGKGVDLSFEINGKKAQTEIGKENVPGGEIYMAPKKRTLNGYITFDYPVIESGREIEGIFLRFENGEIVELKADKNEEFLRHLTRLDKNAGYVGEFGIGINKNINRFTKNILFDEKIIGTIHLALGQAYKENGGGNHSAIHLDIIKDMKKAKIILDGKIIQENGNFKI